LRKIVLVAAIPALLAACSQQSSDDVDVPDPAESPIPVEPDGGIGDGATPLSDESAAPVTSPGTDERASTPESSIPAALQGRWGMVAADCTSTRGDAKGLLRISPTTLTFYESVGRLASVKERSDTRLRADYAFTGEGMNWTRDVTLTVSADGGTLTRLERGGDGPGGPFTYNRCG
jgi:hypothetical protein